MAFTTADNATSNASFAEIIISIITRAAVIMDVGDCLVAVVAADLPRVCGDLGRRSFPHTQAKGALLGDFGELIEILVSSSILVSKVLGRNFDGGHICLTRFIRWHRDVCCRVLGGRCCK